MSLAYVLFRPLLLQTKAACLNETLYSSPVIQDSRPAAADKRRFVRQRGLLLEKLEDFKRLNKSARQKLKQLQDSEVGFPLSLTAVLSIMEEMCLEIKI